MKICTLNIDRSCARDSWRKPGQVAELEAQAADAYVVTETYDHFTLNGLPAKVTSAQGAEPYPPYEHASGIWTDWDLMEVIASRDPQHVGCGRFHTPLGKTLVYGTIFPYFTGPQREIPHRRSAGLQIEDWRELRARFPDDHLVIAGDLNMTMGGSERYVVKEVREAVLQACQELGLTCLTNAPLPDVRPEGKVNIDHVIVSNSLKSEGDVLLWMPRGERNGLPRDLSDHNGVTVTLALR